MGTRTFKPPYKKRIASRKEYDHFKTHALGAAPVPALPPELLAVSRLIIQTAQNCTAYTSVDIREPMTGKQYDADRQWDAELKFSGVTDAPQGFPIDVPLAVGIKVGFFPIGQDAPADQATAYFFVRKTGGMDWFDSCRVAMYQLYQKYGKVIPLMIGVNWFGEWDNTPNGIIPDSGTHLLGGHDTKIAGFENFHLDHTDYIVIQGTWGPQFGDNGLFRVSREVFNKWFEGYGAAYWTDDPDLTEKKLGWLDALLVNLRTLYETLLNYRPFRIGFPPPSITALDHPSPNFTKGRNGRVPTAIVLHVMAGSIAAADSWFADPYSNVSAHYGIAKDGTVHHYVHESDMAWHAGQPNQSSWDLLVPGVNPNLYTIGIEHEGGPADIWPDAQKQASAELVAAVAARWNISIDREHIIGHYQIDGVNRPNCPAYDKSIIDQIISLAKTKVASNPSLTTLQ